MDAETKALIAGLHVQMQAMAAQNAALMQLVQSQSELIAQLKPAVPSVPSITINEIFDRFDKSRAGTKNWKKYRQRLLAFVKEFRDWPAMNVTPARAVEFRNKRKGENSYKGKLLSPLTVTFELDWAKTMLFWAADEAQGLIPSNPLARLHRESIESAQRETWLTEPDLEKLLGFCDALVAAFVLLAVYTALRLSEVLSIRKASIRRMIEIDDDGNEHDVGIVEFSKRRTKSKKAHLIAIPPRVLAAIDALPPSVNPHIFASPYKTGRHYTPGHMRAMFRDACLRAGVDAAAADGDLIIRVHDLRHTAATLATKHGATLSQVQRLLNHSTPAITSRYVHHDEGGAVRTALLIEKGIAGKRRGPKSIGRRPAEQLSGDVDETTPKMKLGTSE